MLRFGLLIALLVVIADQASKVLVLASFADGEVLRLTPFFNLVLVWNRGVSFGMLGDGGTNIPWLLSGLALAVVIALIFWLRAVEHHLIALGLGLVIGGALGNVIDRIRFGAVVDFLDFHAFGYHWPAFNIADSAICVGAVVLLVDGLLAPRRRTT
jgi:signal peptidase II